MAKAKIYPICDKLPRDRSLIGGKAAGLGELCRAGAPVPDGVVIVLPSTSPTPPNHIKKMVIGLLESSSDKSTLFAVRSSTISEDGIDASFAGMFQTFLNVRIDKIWAAVAACVKATTSERVQCYQEIRRTRGEKFGKVIPIIIQRMVPATIAGVAFTANPITGNPNHYTIEAAPGLGESVVSGAVTPDMYVVDIGNNSLVNFEPGDWPGAGITTALQERQLILLLGLMRLMRSQVNYEIDLEFAFFGNELFALQMRPITAYAERFRA